MRKRLTGRPDVEHGQGPQPGGPWWDLERLAQVEVTSEADGHPIEAALTASGQGEWRAGGPGPQTIRLIFDEPQHLRRVELVFEEAEAARTQEFVLRWLPEAGGPARDILRQQWTFSPPGTVREAEAYRVDALHLKQLELTIIPDISGGGARASLSSLRLG